MATIVPVWEVKLFQLNVSQDKAGGDCAIILLLNTAPKKPKVASAVLVDGGDGPRCTKMLISTMQDLEKKYVFDSPGNKFKFDAVSISHWDTVSHINNYQYLFTYKKLHIGSLGVSTLRSFLNITSMTFDYRGFCWKYTTTDAYNFLKDPEYGFIGDQHAAFRYDKTQKPLTRFYCQNFSTVPTARTKPSKNRDMNPDSKIKTANRPMNTKIGGVTVKNFLDGYLDTEVILGVNLFNGKQVANPAATTGLVSLIKGNDPSMDVNQAGDRKGAPGLYVWGVNKQGLGGQSFGIFETGKNPTNTNAGSVMLLLVWVKNGVVAANVKKEDIIVSLYTGADAEYTAEGPLTTWLKNDFKPAVQAYKINVLKAGHHGGGQGTSMSFIEAVKPDHFLMSSGSDHIHPRLEVSHYTELAIRCHSSL